MVFPFLDNSLQSEPKSVKIAIQWRHYNTSMFQSRFEPCTSPDRKSAHHKRAMADCSGSQWQRPVVSSHHLNSQVWFARKSEALKELTRNALDPSGHSNYGLLTLCQSQFTDDGINPFFPLGDRNTFVHPDLSVEFQMLPRGQRADEKVILLNVSRHGHQLVTINGDAINEALAGDLGQGEYYISHSNHTFNFITVTYIKVSNIPQGQRVQ